MDLNGIQKTTMGKVNRFGWPICCSLDNSMTRLVGKVLHNWESIEDGCIRAIVCGEKITIDQTLIVQQIGVSAKGAVDVSNTLVKEAQIALKNIVKSNAFVNKE